MQNIYIGTSGWNYDHWKGIFYPESCSMPKRLEYYAKHFTSVEINTTFYHILNSRAFENWYKRTPDDFQLSVKAYRYITHIKWKEEFWRPLKEFRASLVSLKDKLGPTLFQFPPTLTFDKEIFERFCRLLEAGQRYTIEAQHPSWLEEDALSALKQHQIAWCISDKDEKYPYLETATSDFIYIRLHGSKKLSASEYSEDELVRWAEKIEKWHKDTYVYFDNDYMGYAPKNASRLKELLYQI
jgi:uncharacterized protein YecE (DUF72 family)